MVKNTGGNKAKGYARKNLVKGSHALRASEDPAEIYAQVIKLMGGSICRVNDLKGQEMTCHIRGKFRGRGKRDNTLTSGTWVLVGLREWEHEASGDKLLNCDLIEVYSDSDKVRLKNSITHVDWSPFIANDTRAIGAIADINDVANDIEFADDKTQEYRELIEAHLAAGKSTIITTDDGQEVDVDDI
jgi:translation initiation factor IF-1